MSTEDLAPQPQGYAPRSRQMWIWSTITRLLLLSAVGLWISAVMAIFSEPHLQVIGSGWWQDGGIALSALLYALAAFSSKMSVLITRRIPRALWLKRVLPLDFSAEATGLALFLVFGVLPLYIHNFILSWGVGHIWAVLLVFLLISKAMLFRREVATQWTNGNDTAALVADRSRLSRRTLLSGGAILGMSAAGLVTAWRALPTLIPDFTFFGHSSTVRSLSWFPDGRRIASIGSDGQFLTWNGGGGSDRRTLASLRGRVGVARISPNGALIAANVDDMLYVWDATTGTLVWTLAIGYAACPFSWAPDSARLVVVHNTHDVGIIDVTTRTDEKTVFALPEHFNADIVAWSPDGSLIAAASEYSVIMWDATSGIQRDWRHTPPYKQYSLRDLAWSPDGHILAVSFVFGLAIWYLADGSASGYREFGNTKALAWSPDGRYIASCGFEDKSVRVWVAATGKTVFVYNGHFSSVETVAWSPDGTRIASGGYDKLVHVWRPILPA